VLGEARGLFLRERHDLGRMLLGHLALGLDVGQQALGFLAQLGRLVELGLDAMGAVVERLQRHARHLQPDQREDEQQEAERFPEVSCARVDEIRHERPSFYASARSTSSALGADPVSFSMIAWAVSAAMPRTWPIASVRAAEMRASASAITFSSRASSSSCRLAASAATAALASAASLWARARASASSSAAALD